MRDRKQRVIESAFRLFMTKGFQATSIQDILDDSQISKGTFYKYFSSKQEVLIASLKSIQDKLVIKRDAYLLNKPINDKEVFMEQILLFMASFTDSQLSPLFNEITASHQDEIKKEFRAIYLQHHRWIMGRLQDVFGTELKEHLLDLTLIFINSLIGIFRYNQYELENPKEHKILVQFVFNQIEVLAKHAITSDEILFRTSKFDERSFRCSKKQSFSSQLIDTINIIKSKIKDEIENRQDIEELMDLLDFLPDELLQTKNPRKSMAISTLFYLENKAHTSWKNELLFLREIIDDFFIIKTPL